MNIGSNTSSPEKMEEFWRSILTGEKPAVPMSQIRTFFAKFPSRERCECCNIPFTEHNVFNFSLWSKRSNVSPHFCKKCKDFAKSHIGGAEVCMTMLFADIRGSTQKVLHQLEIEESALELKGKSNAHKVYIGSMSR